MVARIEIVGVGWWATFNHIPTLAQSPDARVVALCDRDAERLAWRENASPLRRAIRTSRRCWRPSASMA